VNARGVTSPPSSRTTRGYGLELGPPGFDGFEVGEAHALGGGEPASGCLRKCMLASVSADVFQVLAEPRRRELLALLADEERTAGEIAARFEVTRQAISQHLRILLAAGLIRERRDGARRWYLARPEGLEEVRAYVEAMWPDALNRLKTAAEREHASGGRGGAS
jgi:DNA-binding transcriptional ArsR family regulator